MRFRRRALFAAPVFGLLGSAPSQAASATLPADSQPDFTILCIGQSNMDGTSPLPPSPVLLANAREERIPWCFYKDRTWGLLQDPYAGGESYFSDLKNAAAGASVAPGIARRLMPTVGNLAFVPAAKAGSSISSWLYTPRGGRSYLDMSVEQMRASGRVPDLALWWQGETDSKTGTATTGPAWKNCLAQIAARIYAEFGCPLMVGVIQTNDLLAYANQTVIQQAQRESWTEIPHIVQGPDLSDIATAPENAVHLAHPAKIDTAAARWAERILLWRG